MSRKKDWWFELVVILITLVAVAVLSRVAEGADGGDTISFLGGDTIQVYQIKIAGAPESTKRGSLQAEQGGEAGCLSER